MFYKQKQNNIISYIKENVTLWFFYLRNIEFMENIEPLVIISEAIATIQDKEDLFQTIHDRLKQWYNFQLNGIINIEPETKECRIFWTGTGIPVELLTELNNSLEFKYQQLSLEPFSFDMDNPRIKRVPVVTSQPNLPPEMKRAAQIISLQQISELLYIPLLNRGQLQGFLILAFRESGSVPDDQLPLLASIGNLIAGAVINTRNYEEIAQREQLNKFQLDFTNKILAVINQPDVFLHLAYELNLQVEFELLNLVVISNTFEANLEISYLKNKQGEFKYFRIPDGIKLNRFELESYENLVQTKQKVVRLGRNEINLLPEKRENILNITNFEIASGMYIPLKSDQDGEIILFLASSHENSFSQLEIELLQHLVPQLQLILENYYAFAEINSLRSQLEQEKLSLLKEMNEKNQGDSFIAQSEAMAKVLRRVKQVAPIDTTVLIEGETGVGKELIASALHNNSTRSAGPLVKVNCAALPAQLIESELFGHEKGSFTGATNRRIGKFELANGGTIFLDEIGELPIELQSKLLRVIQEKEFERIGGHSVIRSNVRILAATNRNLEKEVEAGRFRSDLFYRLNVFLIEIPPLRQRRTDIPGFVGFFTSKYCRRIGKPAMQVRESDLLKLMEYQWPGNIRELEHTIERAIVISQGPYLDLSDFRPASHLVKTENQLIRFKSLKDLEAEHILQALELTNGRVSGEKGAAKLLGINGKTLDSKMRKLGIRREILVKIETPHGIED